MLLQAESVNKFLEPCCHWIIINEKMPDVEAWEELLNPFYNKHELKIIPQHLLFENKENVYGHFTQQICKLAIAKLIKDDYLILDSKNFFIKSSSINDWDSYIGSGMIEFVNEPPDDYIKYQPYKNGNDKSWSNAIEQYKNMLGLKETPSYFLKPMTPFKIEYQLLKNSNLLDNIFHNLLFVDEHLIKYGPSEFILYSFLVNDKIIPGENTIINNKNIKTNCISYFSFDSFAKEVVNVDKIIAMNSNVNMFGLHRIFLEKCGPRQIKIINDYLEFLGFKFKFN